jgi:hypothetical protein
VHLDLEQKWLSVFVGFLVWVGITQWPLFKLLINEIAAIGDGRPHALEPLGGFLLPRKIWGSLFDKVGDTFLEIVAFEAGCHIEIGRVSCFCERLKKSVGKHW